MGVRGLTSYVNTHEGLFCETYKLRDTRLVIDGNGLQYYLYDHLDCKYGGQYGEFEEKVKVFFNKLTSHGVTPYVVFDGILDDTGKKLQTILVRKEVRIKRAYDLWNNRSSIMIKPHLIYSTLIKILQELHVAHATADFEADSDIASLANALPGPVMGLDSDYFIFNIEEGYIPFNEFDFSGSSVMVKRFHSAKLAKHLNIHPTMLPVLASLVGNDYVSEEMLKPFKIQVMQVRSLSQSASKGKAIILGIAQFLSRFQSCKDAIAGVLEESLGNNVSLKEALCLSVAEYQPKSTELIDYFATSNLNSKLQTCNKLEVPKWLIKLYREGTFAKQCMSCLCHRKVFFEAHIEDMSKPSANRLTLKIRKFIYKLLMKYDEKIEGSLESKEVVTMEYDRERLSLNQHKIVLVLSTDDTEVNISNLSTLDKPTKVTYLSNVLSCDLPAIQYLPNSCQLVVAALRYWIINAKPPVTEVHLASLLAYYVGMNDDQIQRRYHRLDVQGLHGFAQWQDVVYWVSYLNSIFGNEFPSLDPVQLYDGEKVCKLYENLKSNGIQTVDIFVSDMELYKQLYDAVIKKLPSHVTFIQSGRATEEKKSKEQKSTETEENRVMEFLRGNRFAKLFVLFSDED